MHCHVYWLYYDTLYVCKIGTQYIPVYAYQFVVLICLIHLLGCGWNQQISFPFGFKSKNKC